MAAPIHLNLVYFPSSLYKTSMLLRLAQAKPQSPFD